MPTPQVYYELSSKYDRLQRKAFALVEAVTAFSHVYEGRSFDPEADYQAMKQLAQNFYDDALEFYPDQEA